MANKEATVIAKLEDALEAAKEYPQKRNKNKIMRNIGLALAAAGDLD